MDTQKDQVTIEINDTPLQARQGQMLIEVADANGISIPRFCYHKKLSVSANCRMCLVEVEKAPKPLPACATPVTDGMKAWTKSPRAIASQKSVMEFLLINHPLDCPVCDQGGECDLQEMALGYGGDQSRYSEKKRIVKDKDYGPLVSTEMTRCIHCTRCVRFGTEIAGIAEIGGTGRGDHMEIGTYVRKALSSELSGNIIDLCPVGALLSKPFLFSARSWELKSVPGVAPHDAVGSNIQIQTRNGKVMRVIPQENEAVNEIWISDRDRFSYLGLDSSDRITQPMVRNSEGTLVESDWQGALEQAVTGLSKIAEGEGGDAVGALASPSRTVEELYLLQKLMRGLGSNNIDHRLLQQDFSGQSAQGAPQLGCSIEEIERQNAVLIVGSDIQREQPLLSHRIRKAALAGATVSAVNPEGIEFNFPLSQNIGVDRLIPALASIAGALVESGKGGDLAGLSALVADAAVGDAHRAMAESLLNGEQAMVLMGESAYRDGNQAVVHALVSAIAVMSGATLSVVTEGANALGGDLAGAVPHHEAAGAAVESIGATAAAMATEPPRGLLLMGVETDHDLAAGAAATDAIIARSEFVVSIASFGDRISSEKADVVLPLAAFTETSGTFVNGEGRWQSFAGAVAPKGESRPGWKILRVLGTLANIDGFDHDSSEEVVAEVRGAVEGGETKSWSWQAPADLGNAASPAVTARPVYSVDSLVRRSEPLQKTPLAAGNPHETTEETA